MAARTWVPLMADHKKLRSRLAENPLLKELLS